MAVSKDNILLLTRNKQVFVINLNDYSVKTVDASKSPNKDNIATAVDWSPDGTTFVTGYSKTGALDLWDATDLSLMHTFDRGDGQSNPRCTGAKFSPSGEKLISSYMDSTIRVWQLAKCKQHQSFADGSCKTFTLDVDPTRASSESTYSVNYTDPESTEFMAVGQTYYIAPKTILRDTTVPSVGSVSDFRYRLSSGDPQQELAEGLFMKSKNGQIQASFDETDAGSTYKIAIHVLDAGGDTYRISPLSMLEKGTTPSQGDAADISYEISCTSADGTSPNQFAVRANDGDVLITFAAPDANKTFTMRTTVVDAGDAEVALENISFAVRYRDTDEEMGPAALKLNGPGNDGCYNNGTMYEPEPINEFDNSYLCRCKAPSASCDADSEGDFTGPNCNVKDTTRAEACAATAAEAATEAAASASETARAKKSLTGAIAAAVSVVMLVLVGFAAKRYYTYWLSIQPLDFEKELARMIASGDIHPDDVAPRMSAVGGMQATAAAAAALGGDDDQAENEYADGFGFGDDEVAVDPEEQQETNKDSSAGEANDAGAASATKKKKKKKKTTGEEKGAPDKKKGKGKKKGKAGSNPNAASPDYTSTVTNDLPSDRIRLQTPVNPLFDGN
eukprot:gene15243-4222_t